ncbi:hypothetical protein F7725_006628 [Dissostichus mawsoni]|uniref:Uncharacterized protein n=1 Tax=Dissostichus mawsoni TaxID=36200 RepID=A0A7J5XUF1_DISMA|nr:hypothetical protein F7725_006628 [Dissostichus mawsoni]
MCCLFVSQKTEREKLMTEKSHLSQMKSKACHNVSALCQRVCNEANLQPEQLQVLAKYSSPDCPLSSLSTHMDALFSQPGLLLQPHAVRCLYVLYTNHIMRDDQEKRRRGHLSSLVALVSQKHCGNVLPVIQHQFGVQVLFPFEDGFKGRGPGHIAHYEGSHGFTCLSSSWSYSASEAGDSEGVELPLELRDESLNGEGGVRATSSSISLARLLQVPASALSLASNHPCADVPYADHANVPPVQHTNILAVVPSSSSDPCSVLRVAHGGGQADAQPLEVAVDDVGLGDEAERAEVAQAYPSQDDVAELTTG